MCELDSDQVAMSFADNCHYLFNPMSIIHVFTITYYRIKFIYMNDESNDLKICKRQVPAALSAFPLTRIKNYIFFMITFSLFLAWSF